MASRNKWIFASRLLANPARKIRASAAALEKNDNFQIVTRIGDRGGEILRILKYFGRWNVRLHFIVPLLFRSLIENGAVKQTSRSCKNKQTARNIPKISISRA
jgi:hypothetical protein